MRTPSQLRARYGHSVFFRMKIISIHQPHYHSWLGLLHKIACSDEHIILDDVQFRKRNFQNRAQYSSPQGSKLLSLPVNAKGHQSNSLTIEQIELPDSVSIKKNFQTLKHRYCKTPGWRLISDTLEELHHQKHSKLVSINMALLEFTLSLFQIDTPLIMASKLEVEGVKNQRLINLCLSRHATHYLSGNGAKKYMDDVLFARHGLQVEYQQFSHPVYSQGCDTDFQPGCMAIDWYCHQPEEALRFFQEPQPLNTEIYARS